MIIPDMQASQHYHDSHLANTGIRFYAGAPLLTQDGQSLGAMCVLGHEPREITAQEQAALTDLAAMAMAQIELQHAFGRVDPLTGMRNRGQFDEDLHDLAFDTPGAGRAALFVDVVEASQLSALHRTMGPAFLDELTQVSAQCLQQAIGQGARLYSLGGCQFVHLAPLENDAALIARALRLREDLMALESAREVPVLVRPVVSIAPFALGDTTPSDLLRSAHAASLDARLMGESAGVFSAELDGRFQRSSTLLADVDQALEHDEAFYLVFQPRVSVASGRCDVAEALLPAMAIELEVTESALIGKGEIAAAQLDTLIAAGILIAIDDFGTGYSSLSYLHQLPANIVKIDRCFITHLGEDARTQTLVGSIVNMAHDLGYRVVAEGVETTSALDYLGQLGCDEVQGYLLAKPLMPSDFEAWLAERE